MSTSLRSRGQIPGITFEFCQGGLRQKGSRFVCNRLVPVAEGVDDCLVKRFGKGERMAERAAERGQCRIDASLFVAERHDRCGTNGYGCCVCCDLRLLQ